MTNTGEYRINCSTNLVVGSDGEDVGLSNAAALQSLSLGDTLSRHGNSGRHREGIRGSFDGLALCELAAAH
jgi:hypothetical protein